MLGLQVWCQDEAGPYQAIPQPGPSWQPTGEPAHRPHEYVRGGTAKLLTLFRPATGEVRAEPVEHATNAVLERVKSVTSTCVASVVEGDRVAINWVFEFVYRSGKTGRFDEVALQEWRGDRVFRERFFYDPSKPV